MKKSEIVEKLRSAYMAATVKLPDETYSLDAIGQRKACNADLKGEKLPLTMFEVVYTFDENDALKNCEVKPIVVTRFGILHEIGAKAPTIDFIDSCNRQAIGSVDMFYLNEESALAEVNYVLADDKRRKANIELDKLVREHLLEVLPD